jgi:hypothetical protein
MSLADLERFDPRAPDGGKRERRFCCPACGTEKPVDQKHRSMAVNTATGLFTCHRCQAEGKLSEWFEDRPAETKAQRARAQAMAAFTGRRSTRPARGQHRHRHRPTRAASIGARLGRMLTRSPARRRGLTT